MKRIYAAAHLLIFSIRWIFMPLSIVYGLVASLRRLLFTKGILKSYRLPGYTISVGNLEVGGTGKTPIVIFLAQTLMNEGKKVAILSRGYKSGLESDESAVFLGDKLLITPQKTNNIFADEARLQAVKLEKTPVIIGANRYHAAKRYLEQFPAPDVWILDDGFQHLRLQRDENLLLLDETSKSSAYFPMPSGRLREFFSSYRFADKIIFTRAKPGDQASKLQLKLQNEKPCFRASFLLGEVYTSDLKAQIIETQEKNKRCAAVCAIAKPSKFLEQLEKDGWQIVGNLCKTDHQSFDKSELEGIANNYEVILTTEKDFFRNKEIFTHLPSKVYIVGIKTIFDKKPI